MTTSSALARHRGVGGVVVDVLDRARSRCPRGSRSRRRGPTGSGRSSTATSWSRRSAAPFSSANAIALSRDMPESRTGASTCRSGASAPMPTSKRTWSLPLPVQPWATDRRAVVARRLDEVLDDDRPGQRRDERVAVEVERVGLERRQAVVVGELVLEVEHERLHRTAGQCSLADRRPGPRRPGRRRPRRRSPRPRSPRRSSRWRRRCRDLRSRRVRRARSFGVPEESRAQRVISWGDHRASPCAGCSVVRSGGAAVRRRGRAAGRPARRRRRGRGR